MTEFEKIYAAYFRNVERYLLALCKNPDTAEELTAQVFFKAMESLKDFRGDCDIRTWLCAIGRNQYLQHLRNNRLSCTMEEIQASDTGQSVEEMVFDKHQVLAVHRALHALPEPYKEVFSLRVFGQLSFADIGNLFGRSQNWACVTYHRARQKIRETMEVQDGN